MKKHVLVISSANVDLSMRVERVPAAGETLVSNGSYSFTPGGKGGNSAIALAKLGGNCSFCASLGSDNYAKTLKSYYEKNGVLTSQIHFRENEATGFALVMHESDGENRIVVYPGANNSISREDVLKAFECNPDALYMQFEIPSEIVIYASEIAHRRGIPVFIDAGPASKDFPLEELRGVEIFSPNESECEVFSGIAPVDTEHALCAIDKLRQRVDAKFFVLKLGARGALVSDGHIYKEIEPYKVEVVDTTAAGDAFTAALTLRYLDDGDIAAAAQYAAAVGALTVKKRGAGVSTPTDSEVEQFLISRGEYIF